MKPYAWFLLFVALLVGWQSVVIVDEKQYALIFQFGDHRRTITDPGLSFKLPFVQQTQFMESRIMARDTRADEYLTLDKKKLVADPITRWKIANPLRFYETVLDEERAAQRLDEIVTSEMREAISKLPFGDIIGSSRTPLTEQVASDVRAKAEEFGILVVDVRIKRADLPEEVQDSVFQRMRAERERAAKEYRSEGKEEEQKIRAQTDKEVTILLATAYESSQKLRGEGDQASAKIYAEAYGEDPEFYTFVRSLDAYERSVNEDTKFVLSSKSDLFEYLLGPGQAR